MEESFNSLQIKGFRRMSPAQKLELIARMHGTGVQLKMAGLRLKNPHWPDERLEREARRSLLHAGT